MDWKPFLVKTVHLEIALYRIPVCISIFTSIVNKSFRKVTNIIHIDIKAFKLGTDIDTKAFKLGTDIVLTHIIKPIFVLKNNKDDQMWDDVEFLLEYFRSSLP